MKLIIQIITVGMAFYCMIAIIIYFFQEKMLFYPMGTPFGTCSQLVRYNAKAVNVDGIRYYLKQVINPENWIVIYHGNAGNACDRTYFYDLLSGFNSNIVLFEYPGFGGDLSVPDENIIREKALALVSYIKKTESEKLPIFLMGESMGTGVATWVSTQTSISGLILISAYTSMADVAQNHYPWLPVRYLLKHKFLSNIWAKQTDSPAILFHGLDDDIIPIKLAREQVTNFKGRARLIEIDDCKHNNILGIGETVLKKEIKKFIISES
ncbi:MAG: hypothetical protein B6I31_00995 [Desulfobacteraceae bacterium 4572_19]|nr:MAG: hypothetical protein B6I31_00995 [Desulfobacteraceae bacterium 4572_19]